MREIDGSYGRHADIRNQHKILVEGPEGMRPVDRSRRMLHVTIATYPKNLGCEGVEWIKLVQDRVQTLVNTL